VGNDKGKDTRVDPKKEAAARKTFDEFE